MRGIGEVIKEARERKRLSRTGLEKKTKIKRVFIDALEKEQWENLPEFPVIQGFVRNIALVLTVDEKRMIALLRRDYPPKFLRVSPKPDVSRKHSWRPRHTFIAGMVVALLVVLLYLGVQYINFVSAPKLEVIIPQEGEVVTEELLVVSGITSSEMLVRVNNQLVLVDENGSFEAEVEIFEGTEEIVVQAISRAGKETIVRRKIRPELGERN
jgi:cytoskeletal protein RodZ